MPLKKWKIIATMGNYTHSQLKNIHLITKSTPALDDLDHQVVVKGLPIIIGNKSVHKGNLYSNDLFVVVAHTKGTPNQHSVD